MSSNYLLLKENNQDAILSKHSSNNQTILIEDANASSTLPTLKTLELGLSDLLIDPYFGSFVHQSVFKTD